MIPHSRFYTPAAVDEMQQRSQEYLAELQRRRTVRDFSADPVSRDIIENCIRAAATAPSGANQQPWKFIAVSDPALKQRIRTAAEQEEYEFYHERAPQEWLDALTPFQTDWHKPFLETAPWLIAIFAETYSFHEDGSKRKHYYVQESVGIATGFLIAALHHAGLATLTHTPSPMKFLNDLLERPVQERPFLLLVVGYPATEAEVPDITKKPFDEIAVVK